MESQQSLVILGASVRAAAFSALHAGYHPWCCDLFGDRDLISRVPSQQISRENYPKAFLDIVETAPNAPWMFTGGLENHPKLVGNLQEKRELWGVHADQLVKVRDPLLLQDVCARHGVPHPRVLEHPPWNQKGKWLSKPYRSVAGQRIRVWDDASERSHTKEMYYQEFIEGIPTSAVYVGNSKTAKLLGVTRQLIGETWLNASGFVYCGNVGVLGLSEPTQKAYEQLGRVLVTEFGLRGLFGVDCVLRDDTPYPVEINPRYTASVEVIEFSLGIPALTMHRHGCEENETWPELSHNKQQVVGKAIYYTPITFPFPEIGPWLIDLGPERNSSDIPSYTDIPHPGQMIEARHPVFTFFAVGDSECKVSRALSEKAAEIPKLLGIG